MLPGQKTKGAHADARGRSMMRRRRVACEPRSKISCSHQRTRSLLSRALGKPLTHRPLHPLRVSCAPLGGGILDGDLAGVDSQRPLVAHGLWFVRRPRYKVPLGLLDCDGGEVGRARSQARGGSGLRHFRPLCRIPPPGACFGSRDITSSSCPACVTADEDICREPRSPSLRSALAGP